MAEHPRIWARGLTITDTAHVDTAKRLRQEFQQPRARAGADGLVGDPAAYDETFGLTGAGQCDGGETTDAAKARIPGRHSEAPPILDFTGQLADYGQDARWTFDDHLAAVLEREVSARNASGAELWLPGSESEDIRPAIDGIVNRAGWTGQSLPVSASWTRTHRPTGRNQMTAIWGSSDLSVGS